MVKTNIYSSIEYTLTGDIEVVEYEIELTSVESLNNGIGKYYGDIKISNINTGDIITIEGFVNNDNNGVFNVLEVGSYFILVDNENATYEVGNGIGKFKKEIIKIHTE